MTYSSNIVTNSRLKIISNIIISFIGAGILGLPFAFKEAGVFGGIIIMVFVSFISTHAMLLVIKCKYIVGDKLILEEDKSIRKEAVLQLYEDNKGLPYDLINYSDIGFHAFGNVGKLLVDITVILSQTGFCCAYLIFVSKNITNYYPNVKYWQCISACLCFVYVFMLFRNLGKLGYFSFTAQISQMIAFFLVLWYEIPHLNNSKIQTIQFSISGLPFFFAVSIYCFEGAGMILSLESSTSAKLRPKFRKYFICIMFFITFVYISFGLFGYLSFGSATNSIITLNLISKDNSAFIYAIKICLCFSLLLTYPVMMFPVTQLLDKKLEIDKIRYKGNILRTFLVIFTGLIVLLVDNFEVLMGFIGATCCSLLAFIFPGIFHLLLSSNNQFSLSMICDILLIIFGIFVMSTGIWDSIRRF